MDWTLLARNIILWYSTRAQDLQAFCKRHMFPHGLITSGDLWEMQSIGFVQQ